MLAQVWRRRILSVHTLATFTDENMCGINEWMTDRVDEWFECANKFKGEHMQGTSSLNICRVLSILLWVKIPMSRRDAGVAASFMPSKTQCQNMQSLKQVRVAPADVCANTQAVFVKFHDSACVLLQMTNQDRYSAYRLCNQLLHIATSMQSRHDWLHWLEILSSPRQRCIAYCKCYM